MEANYVDAGELMIQAKDAEAKKDYEKAASLYEKVIKAKPTNEIAFTRLMIAYRKLKLYKNELRTIDKGIRNFRELYKKKQSKGKSKKPSVQKLSLQLMKSTGLADKKGIPSYEPEPIGKWLKRRGMVEKKI